MTNRCEIQKRYICTMYREDTCEFFKPCPVFKNDCEYHDYERNACCNPEAHKTAKESTDDPI